MNIKIIDTFSAIDSMENGSKIAKVQWERGRYIYINEKRDIVWDNGELYLEYMNINDYWIIIEE